MNAAAERRLALERRLGISKVHGPVLSVVFFCLTVLAIAAFFGLLKLLSLPAGWVTVFACIGVAELLLRGGVMFRGVDGALWIGGLFAWIFDLPSEGRPEGLLLLAAASVAAGARLRNAWFGALAAIFVIAYFGAKDWYVAALLAGVVLAAVALAALTRLWQRPSTELLFTLLVIVAPIAGAVASVEKSSMLWAFLYSALAAAEIAIGVAFRHRGALFASAVSIAIALVVLRELFAFAVEWKLMAAGIAMFVTSAVIARALRGRARGFVMKPVKSAYEEALKIFGTAAFAPRVQGPQEPQPVGGGGSSGGAGSTGEF